MNIDDTLQGKLHEIAEAVRPLAAQGRVATYIPALAQVPLDRFGIAVVTADGREFVACDGDEPFSIQSVSKVFNLAFALDALGEDLWTRVGREPSGMRFNSLILLESEGGVPRNPLINPGALVVTDALLSRHPDWKGQFLNRMRTLSGSDALTTDDTVLASERAYGDLNRAIAWFLKAKGNLHNTPEHVTETYFAACSTAATCREVARAARFLIGPEIDAGVCRDAQRIRRIRAVMRTCGLYDAAGEFAFRVGLPAKSGVGGGILAVSPGRYAVCVWSPGLDLRGNSVAGVHALEMLTRVLEG